MGTVFSKEVKEALLIIDPQKMYSLERSSLYVSDYKSAIEKINMLIDCFQKKGAPVIYIRHIHDVREDSGRMFDYSGQETGMGFVRNSEEAEYIDELRVDDSITEIEKKRYSCFAGTELDALLRSLGVECVVITGFMTNYCCEATARQAHDLDYYVKFVLDATGTPPLPEASPDEIKKITAANVANGFGVVCNADDLL